MSRFGGRLTEVHLRSRQVLTALLCPGILDQWLLLKSLRDGHRPPVFLPGFHTLGSTGPIKKLKGRGHDGEKWVTLFRYS